MSHESEEIADGFFAAIERNDLPALAAIYHDDVRIWHSYDDTYQNKAENLAVLAGIALLGTPRYRVIERVCAGEKIAQRHELIITGHAPNVEHRLLAAIFLRIRDRQIVALDEYLDSRDTTEVVAAIEQASRIATRLSPSATSENERDTTISPLTADRSRTSAASPSGTPGAVSITPASSLGPAGDGRIAPRRAAPISDQKCNRNANRSNGIS